MYGDGFFETMTLINSKIRFWSYHWERIQKAYSVFDFKSPDLSENQLYNEILNLSTTNDLPNSVIKINFWRCEGGLFTPNSTENNILIQQKQLSSKSNTPITIGISQNVVNYHSPISEIKTMSAAKYILAGLEIKKNKVDDVLILDKNGCCSELSSSNLFIVKNNQIVTPPISSGCVDGVFRKALSNSFSVEEKSISIDEMKEAELTFSTNASGFKIIQGIENKELNTKHPFLVELENWLTQQLHL